MSSSVEERGTIRERILRQLQDLHGKARLIGLEVDSQGSVLGGTTQEKVWNIVTAIEEAERNLTQEMETHP